MNISDNTILITGGATGIGLALAERFIQLGNTVIICGRREEKLKAAKEKLPTIHIKVCDLAEQSEREVLALWLGESFPDLNILVNNAGVQYEVDLTKPSSIDKIEEEVDTNFIAPIHLSALLVDKLKNKKNAAIINISSGLAFTPLAIMPVYCATKAALHSVTLSMRYQLAKTGIKVFEIAPPIVDTELDRGARDKRNQQDRGIKPEEFAIETMEALENDIFEVAIGMAAGLREKREAAFGFMNK